MQSSQIETGRASQVFLILGLLLALQELWLHYTNGSRKAGLANKVFIQNSANTKNVERPKCQMEKGKRNLRFFSPVSREEREIGNSFHQFWEEKEKPKRIFSTFERRKRNGYSILKLQEEKEKVKTISPFSRREREILNAVPQFWEEKEKSRVHNFWEEKEKFSQNLAFKEGI